MLFLGSLTMERFRGITLMGQLGGALASGVVANLSAAVVTAQTHDSGFSSVVTAVTVSIGGLCTMILVVSPMLAKAIREGFPPIITALNDLRKQFEEAKKSTYAGKIDDLTEMVTDLKQDLQDARDREARLEDSLKKARESLHEIRNKQQDDILARDTKIMELEAEIKLLRAEVNRLTHLLEERADAQDKRIEDNTADIKALEQRAGDAA
jgi:hypothetical protein